jgi:Spy/CpxP family protein refolding chaperone
VIASSVKGKVFVLAVFFLGIIGGALLSNVYETRLKADSEPLTRQQRAEQAVKAFHDYLGLTPDQAKQVHEIMVEQGAEFKRLAEETRPQYDEIREETRNQIKALLTDEQKRRYDEWRAKMAQRGQRGPRQNNPNK